MIKDQTYNPILAITMGDPAGIGPEIAAKTFANKTIYGICRPMLVGHATIMGKAIKIANVDIQINKITEISQARFEPGTMDVFDTGGIGIDGIRFGEISALAGDLAFRAVKTAIDLALQGKIDGTVTGPIHKEAINKAGHQFSGHTEIYAHFTNTPKYAMLLADENIKIIHVTTHVALHKIFDLIKKDRILDTIQLLDDGLKKLGMPYPRIGVAGLNPHSSDGGLFGNEEAEEILPAIEEARKLGILDEGPIPADTLFALANGGRFDGCVAMYHDQGHIPFKLLGFNWDQEKKTMKSVKGVNITLGLPIIRTSVDHGTAYEPIGGQSLAPRQHARLIKVGKRSFEQTYRAIHEYRQKFPDKAVIYSGDNYDTYGWAVFMAGGSLACIPVISDPHFLKDASTMQVIELPGNPTDQWALGNNEGKGYIVYSDSKNPVKLDLTKADGTFTVRYIDPKAGQLLKNEDTAKGGKVIELKAPQLSALVMWLSKK